MRKIYFVFITMLFLALTACGNASKEITETPAELAEKLAAETITSDPLSAVSSDILASAYFLDMDQVEDSYALFGNGSTSCEITVIRCEDSDYADEAVELVKNRVKNQADLYITYNAEEAKRLDSAIIKKSGSYVALCVSDDNGKAEKILAEAGF